MSDKIKVNELPEALTAAGTDYTIAAVSGSVRKLSLSNIFNKVPFSQLLTTATTIIGAINELKQHTDNTNTKFEWKKLTTVTGKTPVNLPSTSQEAYILITPNALPSYNMYLHFIRPALPTASTAETYLRVNGPYLITGGVASIIVRYSNNQLNMYRTDYNGTDVSTNSTMTVYHR